MKLTTVIGYNYVIEVCHVPFFRKGDDVVMKSLSNLVEVKHGDEFFWGIAYLILPCVPYIVWLSK